MKKIFTIFALAVVATFSNAQVVLNEVYTDPGATKNEFFEFYNTSTNPIPENLDNYTLVAYYETASVTGFYVLDLPSQTIASKGYYVGSSGNTYNVQGQANLTPDFSWDAVPAGGSLKNFQRNGVSYTEVALPADLNDIFIPRSGSGSIQHIFVFKNGLLINGIFTGTNFAIMPSYIKSMPPLFVDMSGASIDFTINFASYNDNQFEYVNAAAGNDNGYIRLSDGKCGVWGKSTSAITHTPGASNGSASGELGDLTITSYITELSGDLSKSLLVYNITAGTLAAFPVTIEIYPGLGMPGELDAMDVLVESRSINNLLSGDQFVVLPNRNEPVILVAITPSGCFDQVVPIANSLSTLPVHLIRFQGNLNKYNKVTLNWTVADNETVNRFEIERSVNGKEFTTVAMIFATDTKGTADYTYNESINSNDKVMYRLKMFDKGQDIDYSKILVFQTKATNSNDIKIIGNPVKDKLTFSYTSNKTQTVNIKVYEATGKMLMSQQLTSQEGNNLLSLQLASTFKPGMYIVEVANGTERQTAKFVKQ